jgi:GDP-mannose 4,6 dehydratase
MRKCALITGITEQAGSYPADLLLAKGYDVPGLKCQSSSFRTDRIIHLYFYSYTGDPPLVLPCCEVQPEDIYNLAAQSRCRGNQHEAERVPCPRSGTRPGTDEKPGGSPPANVCEPEEMTRHDFADTCLARGYGRPET